jgi:hypothetical protein
MSLKRLLLVLSIVAGLAVMAKQLRPEKKPAFVPQAEIASLDSYDDEFTLEPARNSIPRQIFADPKGNLYVLGSAEDVIGKWWIVRRKRPTDQEWTITDRFQLESGQPAEAIKGYYDETQWPAIFIEGQAQLKPREVHFINRSSRDEGSSWKTVWEEKDTRLTTYDSPLSASSPAGLFRAGATTDSAGKLAWTVYLMPGNSKQIETEHFLPENSKDSAARWIAIDGASRIWVGGDGTQEDGTHWWAIRISEDHGSSWRTVHFSNVPEGTRMIQGIITPGSLWIISSRRGPQGGQLWMTARLPVP